MADRDKNSRSWGWFEVRSVQDDKRIIEGIATTSKQARDGDVIDTKGIQFKLPIPFLYRHSEPMGNVIDAKVSDDKITVRVQVAAAGVSAKIDEYWNLVKSGTVRGLSIGWRTILEAFDKELPGYRIMKSEWLELSAVPVPADANAQITAVRSADEAILAAIGRTRSRQIQNPPGVSGSTRNEKPMKGIKERIAALVSERDGLQTEMETIDARMTAENRKTMTAEESEEFDPLADKARELDKQITRLRAMDAEIPTARPVEAVVDGTRIAPPASARVEVKAVELPKGTLMARAVLACARGAINQTNPADIARRMYPDNREIEIYLRAAVEAADTQTSGWASQLVPAAQQLQNDFLEILRPATVVGRIEGFMKVPFNVRVPVQTGEGAVGWVGEAKAKPVTSLVFDSASLTWSKIAAIVAITEELARLSSPSAEGIVRQSLVKTVSKFIDTQFVDPTVAATTDNPASITNGIASIAPTGTTAAHFTVDMNTLLGTFVTANQDPSDLVILMSATQALALSLMKNDLGAFEFPKIGVKGGEISGLPVVVSESVGARIIALKAGDILLAEDPATRIDVSREASVEMSTTPISGDTSPTSNAVLKSFWQNNLIGIRVERYIKWQRARTSAVAWIAANAYVPSV